MLSDISYILRKERINIESLDANVIGETIAITIMVKDPKKAMAVLAKNGFRNLEPEYFVVKVSNTSESIQMVTTMLKNAKINILQFHMVSSDGKDAMIAIKTNKPRASAEVLKPFLAEERGNYRSISISFFSGPPWPLPCLRAPSLPLSCLFPRTLPRQGPPRLAGSWNK